MIYLIATPAIIAAVSICYALALLHARQHGDRLLRIIHALRNLTMEDGERFYAESATELEKDIAAASRRERT